jgi:bifunctional DNase/RNase
MELSRILIRELNDYQIIELREVRDEDDDSTDPLRSFPIVIGLPEASAIERGLSGAPIKRPQTHELLASVIKHLGGILESVTVTDLSDSTFFATLDVRRGDGEVVNIDCRPSDAIALGVAGGVPVYVEDHVIEGAGGES